MPNIVGIPLRWHKGRAAQNLLLQVVRSFSLSDKPLIKLKSTRFNKIAWGWLMALARQSPHGCGMLTQVRTSGPNEVLPKISCSLHCWNAKWSHLRDANSKIGKGNVSIWVLNYVSAVIYWLKVFWWSFSFILLRKQNATTTSARACTHAHTHTHAGTHPPTYTHKMWLCPWAGIHIANT